MILQVAFSNEIQWGIIQVRKNVMFKRYLTSLNPKCVILGTVAAVLLSAGLAPEALAANSGWLDRDNPGGKGDYENTSAILKIRCRFKGGGKITHQNPKGYNCNLPVGGFCVNGKPRGHRCKDMEVLYSWAGGNTGWLDRDNQSGKGDYENVSAHFKLECRFKGGGKITHQNPKGYNCNLPKGGFCVNGKPSGHRCKDMEVRYNW